jgi:NhaP-type Na+/H+ or K+/H+ antiporter
VVGNNQMAHDTGVLITIVAAVGFGIFAQILAHRWRMPAIVLLLGFGLLLGESGAGIVQAHELEGGLAILVKLAVAIILFEGALNLNLRSLRKSAVEIRNLVTIGVVLSWGITALIARFVAGLSWQVAILFGALMTVTGPTVVQPLMHRIDVPRKLRTILEGEAILIDPIGAILAIAVLDVLLAASAPGLAGITGFVWTYFGRLLTGGVIGGLGALLLARVMRARHVVPSELSNLVALACVWVTFGIAESIQGEAGIMAAVAMGLATQAQDVPGLGRLRRFKETLTTLGISMLFVLLAANLDATTLLGEGISGILAVLLIMVVARPLAVFISTRSTTLNWREKVFVAWVGPRGIIAASVASLFAIALEGAGIPGGQHLLALTFLTIILTVTVQGLTAGWVARLLGLHELLGEKAIIVGASSLGCAVAEVLQTYGRPVVLLDTNQFAVSRARARGLHAVHGNALEEETLEDVNAVEFGTLLAATSNAEVNVLVCQLAHDEFGIQRAYPALGNPAKGANPGLLQQIGGSLAFGREVDFPAWELAGEIFQIAWDVPESRNATLAKDAQTPTGLLPVLQIRKNSADLVHANQPWETGDTIVFIGTGSSEAARAALDANLAQAV